MTGIKNVNPAALLAWFLYVVLTVSLCSDLPCAAISFLLSAVTYRFAVGKRKTHLYFAILFVVMTLLNPLFNRRGNTVLLVINNNPVTLESLLYGAFSALTVISVLYWFAVFSEIMTDDKILYVFGRFSPKTAMVISLALRYVPLLSERAKKVREACIVNGVYGDGNIIEKIKGELYVFSAVTTFALEKGMDTADSMEARGYGTSKRTSYALYKWHSADTLLLCVIAAGAVLSSVCLLGDYAGTTFFPAVSFKGTGAVSVLFYFVYAVLSSMPLILTAKEELKWKAAVSKLKT